MTISLTLLVLGAAVLHAGWNALLKSGADRFRTMTIMSTASGLVSLPMLAFGPVPARASWPAIAISGVIHVAYNLFLVAAYRYGDLGQVYPIARGASPLLVTLGALAIAGERPTSIVLTGITLVSCGIVGLARGWTVQSSRTGLVVALATGGLIAAYTVTDAIGGRASGAPNAYAAWLFATDALPLPLLFWLVRGWRAPLFDTSATTLKALIGGVVSLIAYAIVIYAATKAPMGGVSALRETSVVFAALIGWFFLGETLTGRRLAGCAIVACGTILLGAQ